MREGGRGEGYWGCEGGARDPVERWEGGGVAGVGAESVPQLLDGGAVRFVIELWKEPLTQRSQARLLVA